GMVCVVGRMRDLILQLSKSSIYSTKPLLGRTEIPYAIEDSKRPVEEFDRLADDDLPFWNR
ncbi:hypothetical protein RYZ83_25550, partial [Klebsiella quasipneumoniae]|nr:hypothetical protein [Klebsiella quasipneumoniae]